MNTIVILGAGELGATLARLVAEHELARRVILVDADEGRAKGKALDIRQAGPVEGFDTVVEGAAALPAGIAVDALVAADAADLLDGVPGAAERIEEAARKVQAAVVIAASPRPVAAVDAVIGSGHPKDRVVGSAPLAVAAAVRHHLAVELDVASSEIAATVLGLPPDAFLVPRGAATVGGIPIDAVSATAVRRAIAAVTSRTLGPVALATAAARTLAAFAAAHPAVLPVAVRLDGEYGLQRVTLAVPARIAKGRVLGVLEMALEPVERLALGNAAERRFHVTDREPRRSRD